MGVGAGGGVALSRSSQGVWGSAVSSSLGSGAKPQKLCKFRVMKLQNNTEFHTETATGKMLYAFELRKLRMRTCCSSFGFDVRLTHNRSLSL